MKPSPDADDRVTVHRLSLGDTTVEGAFFARVDGHNVGENGRAFWPTEEEARMCGWRFLFGEIAA